MISKGCIPYRPNDYMYDPIFTVSGPVDHYKAAIVAKMAAAKFQLCPIYASMFSDSPQKRIHLVQRRYNIMSYKEKLERFTQSISQPQQLVNRNPVEFVCPIVHLPPKSFVGPYELLPKFTIDKVTKSYKKTQELQATNLKSVHVQTVYRESTAQTDPWEPPYKITGQGDPEILKLDFLKWSVGLPVGIQEVRLVERARMKRAWENTVKPDINNENSLVQFRDYVEAVERDEWAFREQEIEEIHELRLHLLEKMLDEVHKRSSERAQSKLSRLIANKEAEKQKQLDKIRFSAARELRKLELEQKGVNRKYQHVDVIEEYTFKKSELYAPYLRHGVHPKRWHQVIDQKLLEYRAQYIGVEAFTTLPRRLDRATNLREFQRRIQSKAAHLCIRETKWTAPVLKMLHRELQDLRVTEVRKRCALRVRIIDTPIEPPTPEIERIDDDDYQAVVFVQSLLEGRAMQIKVYEGRENCKELIQELKHSVGLLKKQKEYKIKEKLKVRMQQREETIQTVLISRMKGTLGRLQGHVVGSVLDFLNKELKRLMEERKAHALCWVNERERNIREAAEAGRRQKEIRRRKEHDEIFKQVVKISQDSIDVYLQDVITEGMEFASEAEAKQYVLTMAERVEKQVHKIDELMTGLDSHNEIVADLVHHFVLPEVDKRNLRERMKRQQTQSLKTIHEAIYRKFETLPKTGVVVEEFLYDLSSQFTSVMAQTQSTASDTSFIRSDETIFNEHPSHIDDYLHMIASQAETMEEAQCFESPTRPDANRLEMFSRGLETIPETEHETPESSVKEDESSVKEEESFHFGSLISYRSVEEKLEMYEAAESEGSER